LFRVHGSVSLLNFSTSFDMFEVEDYRLGVALGLNTV
jgi:hypothetical protein